MTKRAELLALASRVEAGTAEQQADLIQDAWDTMGPLVQWGPEQACKFGKMIDAEAYESAAMMLVPGGWSVGLGDLRGYCPIVWRAHLRDHNEPDSMRRQYREGHAATPALALTAACLRALAEKEA